MSRSYKHTPRAGERKSKFYKKYANRRMRHTDDTYNYGRYRKYSHCYDICDYEQVGTSLKEYIRRRKINRFHIPLPPLEEIIEEYYKEFIRK